MPKDGKFIQRQTLISDRLTRNNLSGEKRNTWHFDQTLNSIINGASNCAHTTTTL